MKTHLLLEKHVIDSTGIEAAEFLDGLQEREAKRALTLSIIPGLGQLYNGEVGKGTLFLGATFANILLVSLLFCTAPLLNALMALPALFHMTSTVDVKTILEIVDTGRSVAFMYLALVLSYALYAARDAYDRAREKRRGKVLPRFVLTMPEATSGSYLFHFSIICSLLLAVIFFATPPKPMVQVTDIMLVQENKVPPPKKVEPPKPEPPKVEPKLVPQKPQPQPVEPKLTPVAFAVKTDKPVADPVVQSNAPAPEPAPTTTTGTASGSGDQSAGAAGDGEEVDLSGYFSEVQKRIKKNWFPPRGAESLTVVLKFRILKDGSLGTIKMVRSSGISAADDAAKAAVTASAPFASLPKGVDDNLDVKFTFDYNVFNGKLPAPQ